MNKLSKWIGNLKYLYVKRTRIEEVTINGLKFKIDRELYGERIFRSLCMGQYERREIDIVRKTVCHDDRVLDLGGGIGVVALTAAKTVKPGAVTTVEANPALIALIKQNAARNNLVVDVVHGAVTDKDGMQSFYIANDYWASSSTASASSNRIEVPAVNFADLVERVRPTYLVVDIEGAEVDLLKTLDRASVKKICVEVHPSRTGTAAVSEMVAALKRNGFRLDDARSRKNILYLC